MMNLFYYLSLGILFNAIYDGAISYIKKEELRLDMAQRVLFAILWPLYCAAFIFNYISAMIRKLKDED
jgi:hypothetical protein